MTTPLPAPLPRSLDPLPDESLPGYMLRLAHRLDRSPARIIELVGLGTVTQQSLGPIAHLDPGAAHRFATAANLTVDEVENLCLTSLAGRYAPLQPAYLGRHRDPLRLPLTDPWVFGRWSRYCPQCLAGDGSPIQDAHGGAWQRLWRLPPVFAYAQHRRQLADRCPACRQPALRLPLCSRAEGLHPTQCRNNTRTGRRGAAIPCEHQLGPLFAHAVE